MSAMLYDKCRWCERIINCRSMQTHVYVKHPIIRKLKLYAK